MSEAAHRLATEIYEHNPELVNALYQSSQITDEWLEFCETRDCPACPFYPCHGDAPQHVIAGPSGLIHIWSTRESASLRSDKE